MIFWYITFFLTMAISFLGYTLPFGQMCERSIYIQCLDGEVSKSQYIGRGEKYFRLLKHMFIDSSNKLIRKNLNDVSLRGRRKVKFSGNLGVVSNVSFGMKAFSCNSKYLKSLGINNRTRDNLNDYAFIKCSFSRLNNYKLVGWRVSRRSFCSVGKDVTILSDSKRTLNKNLGNIKNNTKEDLTKRLIANKDLNKEIILYSSSMSIIDKLSTFKIDKCGKYINITKDFLSDPMFLKFAYYLIKNAKGAHNEFDGINDN